jgi:hypothetical protein
VCSNFSVSAKARHKIGSNFETANFIVILPRLHRAYHQTHNIKLKIHSRYTQDFLRFSYKLKKILQIVHFLELAPLFLGKTQDTLKKIHPSF